MTNPYNTLLYFTQKRGFFLIEDQGGGLPPREPGALWRSKPFLKVPTQPVGPHPSCPTAPGTTKFWESVLRRAEKSAMGNEEKMHYSKNINNNNNNNNNINNI